MLPGTNKQSKVSSSVSLYIRDLIHKEVLEEEDIIIYLNKVNRGEII